MIYQFQSIIVNMIGGRLRELRIEAAMDQPTFAAIAGTSKQYVWRLENGHNVKPNPEFIEKWATHFGVRMEWITSGKLPKKSPKQTQSEPNLADDDPWAPVVAYDQCMGLGTTGPEIAGSVDTQILKFRKDSLNKHHLNSKNLVIMHGNGDSMLPNIESGDAIMFDTSDTTPHDKHIYVIVTPGAAADEYNVKRCILIKDNGSKQVFFAADNPDGDHSWRLPRWKDDPDYPIKIIGRVRWIARWVE